MKNLQDGSTLFFVHYVNPTSSNVSLIPKGGAADRMYPIRFTNNVAYVYKRHLGNYWYRFELLNDSLQIRELSSSVWSNNQMVLNAENFVKVGEYPENIRINVGDAWRGRWSDLVKMANGINEDYFGRSRISEDYVSILARGTVEKKEEETEKLVHDEGPVPAGFEPVASEEYEYYKGLRINRQSTQPT